MMDNTKPMKSTKIYAIIITALFAALTAVFSQISIPIGPVPVNLALLAVFTAAGLLSPGRAVLSQVVYLLLGAVGVRCSPVSAAGLPCLPGRRAAILLGILLRRLPFPCCSSGSAKKSIR